MTLRCCFTSKPTGSLIGPAPLRRCSTSAPRFRPPKRAFTAPSICSGWLSASVLEFFRLRRARFTEIRKSILRRKTIGDTSIPSVFVLATTKESAVQKRFSSTITVRPLSRSRSLGYSIHTDLGWIPTTVASYRTLLFVHFGMSRSLSTVTDSKHDRSVMLMTWSRVSFSSWGATRKSRGRSISGIRVSSQ